MTVTDFTKMDFCYHSMQFFLMLFFVLAGLRLLGNSIIKLVNGIESSLLIISDFFLQCCKTTREAEECFLLMFPTLKVTI